MVIRISVPGFAVLLTKLHSSCPFFLMERSCGWSKKIRTRTFAPPRKTVFHNRRNHRRRHRRQGLHHCRHANAPDERSSSSQRTPQTFQALARMGPGMALKEIINTRQHKTTQDNTRQHKTTQHNTTQHNSGRRGTIERDLQKKLGFCPNQPINEVIDLPKNEIVCSPPP